MKCPQCQSELVKGKNGYLCWHCGWSGSVKGGQTKTVASPSQSNSEPSQKVAPPPAEPADESDHQLPITSTAPPPKVPLPSHPPKAQVSTEDLVDSALANHAAIDHKPSLHLTEHGQSTAKPVGPGPVFKNLERPKPVRTITLVIVAALVGMGLAAAYFLPAQAQAKQLSAKLASAQSFNYSGSLKISGASFLSVLNSDVSFNGSYAKSGRSDQLNYSGTFASRNYTGQAIITGGQLYSRMTGSDLPFIRYNQGIATYRLTPGGWYSFKLDNSLYKNYCETKPDTRYPSPLVWDQAIKQIKSHPSALIIYDQKIDGHTTTHLRGNFTGKDLELAWNNINSSLPPGCEWNNLLEDVSGMNASYDLYTSKDYDQIQLHFNDKELGIKGTLVLKLTGYNQADSVTAPTSAKSLADVFSGRAAIQARDYQRRADIDSLKKALDAYAAANKKTPPSSLAKLVPKYIKAVPKDPNGSDYKYVLSKKTYTLSATLEDAGQQYVVTGP